MTPLRVLAPLLIVAFALACGDDDGPDTEATQRPGASPTATAIADRPAATVAPAVSSGSLDGLLVRIEAVVEDDRLVQMTGMYPLPDGRWLVTLRTGRVLLVDLDASTVDEFMDIGARVSTEEIEEGLLGLALAPDFAQSGDFYLYFTDAGREKTVLSRFTADPGGDTASPGKETVIIEVPQFAASHNGGQLAFGPDGYLFLGVGDGSSGRDPLKNGQKVGTIQASLLRIDVSGGDAGYSIPPDNPFVDQPGARGEIWAYGLRNPWRFSFDTATGDLWLGDVGEDNAEEVNLIVKGGNYGWSVMEGAGCFAADSCDTGGMLLPVLAYDHQAGCAVTGGCVYHGGQIPALVGAYVYGDYCSGKVWALRAEGTEVIEHRQIASLPIFISSFAQGNDGEIYVLDFEGIVYKIVP